MQSRPQRKKYMLAARRVAVRAAAAAMTSYAANDRARSDRDGPVRDDSVYDHPPFALRQVSQTETEPSARWGGVDASSSSRDADASSSSSDDDDGKVAMLRRHFPAAPRAELKRFADARPDGGAVEFYRAYQRWRLHEGAAETLQRKAAPLVVGGDSSPSRFIALGERLHQDDGVGKRGDRVVLVEGARFDPAHISSSSYAAHVCRTLDAALASDDASQFVVLIDCRAGKGWPNHGATAFWPLIRELARTVPDCYPERLRCVVVYPLPRWARVSLATATYLLPAKTRQKVWAVAGDDSRRAPVPEEIREKAPLVLQAVPGHAADRHGTVIDNGVIIRRAT